MCQMVQSVAARPRLSGLNPHTAKTQLKRVVVVERFKPQKKVFMSFFVRSYCIYVLSPLKF